MSKITELAYVESHEEETAKKLIDDQFIQLTGKKFGYRPAGYLLALKIYVRNEEGKTIKRDDGTKTKLWIPQVSRDQDKLSSVAALVCAIGPDAYSGKDEYGRERYPSGPWCRVGDLVTIPRQSSFLFEYRGVAMASLPDDKILGIIEDATDVAPLYVSPRI